VDLQEERLNMSTATNDDKSGREWSEHLKIKILDADGWRRAQIPFDEEIARERFLQLVSRSTVQLPDDPALLEEMKQACLKLAKAKS